MASENPRKSRIRGTVACSQKLDPSVAAALSAISEVLNECRVNYVRRVLEERWEDLNDADRVLERLLDPTDPAVEWRQADQSTRDRSNPDQEDRASAVGSNSRS